MAKFRLENFRGPLMRVSFAYSLFKPQEFTSDAGKKTYRYGCTLILPKADAEGMKTIQGAVAKVIMGEWGDKGVERFKKGLIKSPILDGDGKSARNKESGDLHPGMGPDVVFIRPSANEDRKPVVVGPRREPIVSEADCPSGWWGYPVLNCYAWHNSNQGDGVSFGISAFQVVKEDEILGGGGRVDPDKFFDVIGGDSAEELAGAADASSLFN